MNREIKFRVFTKLGMIEDVVVCYPIKDNIYGFSIHIEAFEEQKQPEKGDSWNDDDLEKNDLYQGDDAVIGEGPVMQYTGCSDKNGKEIYEGDIVRMLSDNREPEDFGISVVKFNSGGFVIEWDSSFGPSGESDITTIGWAIEEDIDIEVIGNIYENSGLQESNEETQ